MSSLPSNKVDKANFEADSLGLSPSNLFRVRAVVLIFLCCQNAGHALMVRYSQGVLKETYSSSGTNAALGAKQKMVFTDMETTNVTFCCSHGFLFHVASFLAIQRSFSWPN
jgi:hypothetical protein